MKTLLLTALATLSLSGAVLAQEPGEADAPTPMTATQEEGRTLQADDHILGSDSAPHDLLIYASVTCGHCGAWFTKEWPAVKAMAEAGELRVAIREFPTAPAPVSLAGFSIANCGPEGDWFDLVEGQFAEQDQTFAALEAGQGKARFLELAARAGIDGEDALQTCLESEEAYLPIQRSMVRAEAAGITGVPSFFLDGKPLKGGHDAESLAAALK